MWLVQCISYIFITYRKMWVSFGRAITDPHILSIVFLILSPIFVMIILVFRQYLRNLTSNFKIEARFEKPEQFPTMCQNFRALSPRLYRQNWVWKYAVSFLKLTLVIHVLQFKTVFIYVFLSLANKKKTFENSVPKPCTLVGIGPASRKGSKLVKTEKNNILRVFLCLYYLLAM